MTTSTERKRPEERIAISAPLPSSFRTVLFDTHRRNLTPKVHYVLEAVCVRMILPQVHLRKPCYDFSFL